MAEGNPLDDSSPLAAPLEAVTRLVLRSPGVVLAGSVLLAVLCVLITVNGLTFKTSRLDLLNPRSDYNQRWLAYLAEFGYRDDAVIVVRAQRPEVLARAIDDIAAEVGRQSDLFESIFYRRDLSAFKRKALHFVPEQELGAVEEMVQSASAAIPSDGTSADPASALARLNDRLAHIGSSSPEVRRTIEQQYVQIAGLTLTAIDPQASSSSRPALGAGLQQEMQRFDPQYLLADEGRMGFVLLKLKVDEAEFARGTKAIGQLRRAIDELRARHPEAWIGLTGMPVIEFDEMQASQADMVWTSLASMLAVLGLFIAGYGGLRHSLLANLVLLLATAYSFGFVTLAVGHLNILSAAFSAVLIGLGIDFGIHFLACYLKLRGQGCDEELALIRTSREVGPGMVTGGVTTAAAFFMAAMTDFIGVRELGLVAGGSIVLCVIATVVILPPLVLVVDRRWPIGAVPRIVPAGRWFGFTVRWPRLVMGASLALTVLVAAGCGWLRYDHNLLNLQPKHLESADIERQLFTKLEDSVWFAVALCDSPADLMARKARFEQLPTVAKTEEIASLLPAASTQRRKLIAAIHEHLSDLPSRPPEATPIDPQRLLQEIAQAQQLLAAEAPFETQATALLANLRAALSQLPDAAAIHRLSQTHAALTSRSFAELSQLRAIADPAPPQLADMPAELVDRFVGTRGKYLLKVYARGNVWNMDQLETFVRDVERVDPQVTGHPVQTFYASRHMQQSYVYTGLYALGAVFVLLWIDLRSLLHSLLAMVPLAIGFVLMCGLLGWLDIPLNPANMIVLPVILGIGVDHGVHLVHSWRQQRGRFVFGDSTAVAVLLTATTTTASFGVLVLARHQGLQSLGQVLTLGVSTCLFSSIVFFPAMLRWLSSNRPEEAPDVSSSQQAATVPAQIEPVQIEPVENEPVEAQSQQIKDEMAALVLAASAAAEVADEPEEPSWKATEPEVAIVARRRVFPLAADSGENARQLENSSVLRHLTGPRQSDR